MKWLRAHSLCLFLGIAFLILLLCPKVEYYNHDHPPAPHPQPNPPGPPGPHGPEEDEEDLETVNIHELGPPPDPPKPRYFRFNTRYPRRQSVPYRPQWKKISKKYLRWIDKNKE